ncbi:MAG TPA: hypothetical protein VFL76_10315 [Edaphocola sp.]|nr:hypothetical protein [Edaphocola sp.]
MKRRLTIIIVLLCLGLSARAQIQVGSNAIPTMNKPGKITQSRLDAFKKTTTVFTLIYKDYAQKAVFEKAIASVWKITPFKIIRPDELDRYMKENYSVFSFGGFMINHEGDHIVTTTITLCYDLWMPEVKRSGKVKQHFLARIWMSPDADMNMEGYKRRFWSATSFSEKMLSFIYNDGGFYNWGAGYLKGYLKVVNDHLTKGDEQGPSSELVDRKALAELQKDTLFVPDYVNVTFNPFTGQEHRDPIDMDKVQREYPFPVRFVSSEKLNDMILSGRPMKYLVYIKNSNVKIVDVFDGQTGDLIYVNDVRLSYNFKAKDLGRLAKHVD